MARTERPRMPSNEVQLWPSSSLTKTPPPFVSSFKSSSGFMPT
jgi:hypothetical protein